MAELTREPMLLVTSEEALPVTHRIWGTGGWVPPEQREALDWLILSRLLGWGVTVARQTSSGCEGDIAAGSHWIVIACNPDCLNANLVHLLTARLAEESIVIITRVGGAGTALSRLGGVARRPGQVRGRSLCWIGPGSPHRWYCRKEIEAATLELSDGTTMWASLEGAPLIVARRIGQGSVITLGFHPSQARDTDGAATALLKHLLIWGSAASIAWFDLEGSLVLRMDDPGGAQNIYSQDWCYRKLGESDWAAVRAELSRRNGRLSIGYIGGWVDDGDAVRGVLEVAGQVPHRVPGQVYPSPLVKYQDWAGHAPGRLYDYEAEFRGIQALRTEDLGDIELHGYTHIHPDSQAWATAPTRYEDVSWFRELGRAATQPIASRPAHEHPLALGLAILRRYFDVIPTTLICPGDQWTEAVLERALECGFQFVSSYYLALRHHDHFCWATHVCAPYLEEPDPGWFVGGLPVVGYFHDRDLAIRGPDWFGTWLDRWQAAGGRRLMDFRELAAIVGQQLYVEERNTELRLTIKGNGWPAMVRSVTLGVRSLKRQLPSRVLVSVNDSELPLEVRQLAEGFGRITLPSPSDRAP
jgi:hypothetical protein